MNLLRKTFSLAMLCLGLSLGSHAQTSTTKDLSAYLVQDSLLIPTQDGAQISALVVRKKNMSEKQAAILSFTIYARLSDINKAIEAADKGYVGVVAYSRGKKNSPDEAVPYEYDGQDATTVIDWISKQPWSNQKVAMYGGSYNGFTQWAATKHLHPALKTIVTSASASPGLDVPMTNNVVMNFVFSWTYYTTNNKLLDNADYNNKQWNDLDDRWYAAGTPYPTLDSLLGRQKNKIFRRWLAHPSYDSYWQSMIPYQDDFAKIDIPILSTTGYFDGGQIGEMYYYREHLKYNPKAEHYLLVGPYGHFGAQGYPDSVYNGYKIDQVAKIPIHDLIYQWFDYILKGGAKPAVLKDKVNYQLMGTNQWLSAPSLKQMSNDSLVLYLSSERDQDAFKLSNKKPLKEGFLKQEIDFKDRSNKHSYFWLRSVTYDTLYHNGLMFYSNPLPEAVNLTSNFTGQMKVMINKKDMDYSVVLFELTPEGKYFYLSYFMGRASYATDHSQRKLLVPGQKETLPFSNTYLSAKKLSKGSRIVALVNINKSASEQINYGTGQDVNLESIKDAKEPLRVKWYNDSYIKLPILR